MSLPSLLLVDDSDAILALEKAILSGHYALHTASNGREALEKVERLQPAAVLLDLSMPEMDGDEVLQKMKADKERMADIPVIIISSEKSRAEACLGLGAEAFLPKPFRAEDLLSTVATTLENARRRARAGSMLVLRMSAGEQEFALPLDSVREVLLQPALRPLPGGPPFLCGRTWSCGARPCACWMWRAAWARSTACRCASACSSSSMWRTCRWRSAWTACRTPRSSVRRRSTGTWAAPSTDCCARGSWACSTSPEAGRCRCWIPRCSCPVDCCGSCLSCFGRGV